MTPDAERPAGNYDRLKDPRGEDAVERRRAIERQLVNHPVYLEWAELQAFRQTLVEVYIANGAELSGLLTAASTREELAFELMQNVRDRTVADAFSGATSRALHNYVASSATVVDHARRLMRGRTGELAIEFETRKRAAVENTELPFIQDLRNFTLHRQLPFIGHHMRMSRSGDGWSMESEVQLDVGELEAWDKWTSPSLRFLNASGDAISLRPLIDRHMRLMRELNVWLLRELSAAQDLTEVNELIAERNAALAGVDIETGRRMSQQAP